MSNSTATLAAKKISILGCGWYGLELAKALVAQGYQVKGSSTTNEKLEVLANHQIQPFLVNFKKGEEYYDPIFFQTDILFVCIPPKRSTGEQADYKYKIERIINAMKLNNTSNLIFISSTAVYGDTNTTVTELDIPKPETESGKAILDVENLLKNQTAFTTTILRFAGLVGPKRDPARFFAGKTEVANGQAPINLIHLDDCIGISLSLLKNSAFGYTLNACAPDHPSKQEFYTTAAVKAQLHLPTFKNELLTWKLVSSIQPPIINYNYLVSNWMRWLSKEN
ncbi:NAD(P)H-binding protein [Pedobacter hiemivivus]|uniref:SDR family NAD(P)-dependent oxidoreductase n=1 Tax=Pedobacter hiemivivus TaxID=2530454 RepID=A0A4V2MK87_9SPHI|nr:NAD(P)H-binding protein [Pedobacter hiemivivus]TCC97296.1 SDR family NAD(P)-dependent oxidoreductase [Pedobacter hiemivivus]